MRQSSLSGFLFRSVVDDADADMDDDDTDSSSTASPITPDSKNDGDSEEEYRHLVPGEVRAGKRSATPSSPKGSRAKKKVFRTKATGSYSERAHAYVSSSNTSDAEHAHARTDHAHSSDSDDSHSSDSDHAHAHAHASSSQKVVESSGDTSSENSTNKKRTRRKRGYERTCQTCDPRGRKSKDCEDDCGGIKHRNRKCEVCGVHAAPGKTVCTKAQCGGTPQNQMCKKCGKKPAVHPGTGVVGRIGEVGCCIACGGGPRCTEVDQQGKECEKSAQRSKSGTGLVGKCKGHGGGDRCDHVDKDGKKCKKSARCGNGEVGRCCVHGGGDRCQQKCCTPFPNPSWAKFTHPGAGRKDKICTGFARTMVINARIEANKAEGVEATRLDAYAVWLETVVFKFKRTLFLRAEHVQYYELVKKVPRLTLLKRVLDETVLAALFSKTKNMEDRRPDYFHYYAQTNMALHGEFDEKNEHEDDHDRLREIAHDAGCGWERTYYFRIMAHLDNPEKALFKRTKNEFGGYYVITPRGLDVLDQVAAYVTECLDRMEAGVMPWEERPEDLPIKWFNK